MTHGRPPRKTRWMPTAETLKLARHQAAKPPKDHVDQILSSMRAAHKALREGVATKREWAVVAGSVALAKAIHQIGIVKDIDGHLAAADEALKAIYGRSDRTNAWKQSPLYFQELDALSVFVQLHVIQLRELGRAEFFAAVDRATGQARAAGDTVSHHSHPHTPFERLAA